MIKLKYDKGIKLIYKYVKEVFPLVDRELEVFLKICTKAKSDMLSMQAKESIKFKKFHAQGGSVYSLYPEVGRSSSLRFITAFQTISDYLDNLCDRAGVQDEVPFRQLHLSMLDAVDPQRQISDYYLFYPYKSDNGYLNYLVEECRNQIYKIPSYHLVVDHIKRYVSLYSDLQTYKHLSPNLREKRLIEWANVHLREGSNLTWYEFCAVTGSTLGVFVLVSSAYNPELTIEEVQHIDAAYFPYICGLHILLDYYIDSKEDIQSGDLNFTSYYGNIRHLQDRLIFFIKQSLMSCKNLRYPEFHITIVKGLLAMYLSDPKALEDENRSISRILVKKAGFQALFYRKLCMLLRQKKAL